MKSLSTLFRIGYGPSSSHTIGPYNIAKYAYEHYGKQDYHVVLFGSLALTGVGHGTDRVMKEVLGENTEVTFNKTFKELEHPNTLKIFIKENGQEKEIIHALSIGGGAVVINGVNQDGEGEVYPEKNFDEIKKTLKENNWTLVDYVKHYEPDVFEYLAKCWDVMKKAVERGIEKEGVLPGALKVNRKAKVLYNGANNFESPAMKEARISAAYALAVAEENADNGLIVAAPTCGSCGVLPGIFYYLYYFYNHPDSTIIEGLAVAGVLGNVIKENASLSGAECGCQAEIGSACSMGAGALSYLMRNPIEKVECAAEIALEHNLGLTCDPALGYVQIPCIERNAVAVGKVLNAIVLSNSSSDTNQISFDDVVKVMYKTGKDMNENYRETSISGIAELYKNLAK